VTERLRRDKHWVREVLTGECHWREVLAEDIGERHWQRVDREAFG
jgi:hypothetical protein